MTAIEHHTDCDSLDGSRNYHVGDCHQLAAVISRATGWDFAIFDGAGAHVTVITPDGQYLDITGPRTAEDIRAQWHADKPQITDSIWAEGWDTNPCVCDWRTARAARGPELRVHWNWHPPSPVLTGGPATVDEASDAIYSDTVAAVPAGGVLPDCDPPYPPDGRDWYGPPLTAADPGPRGSP